MNRPVQSNAVQNESVDVYCRFRLLSMKSIELRCFVGVVAACLISLLGCGGSKDSDTSELPPEVEEVTLNILLVDASEVADTAGRRWSAEGLGAAVFTNSTSSEMAENDFQISPDIDVVIYPPELMPEWVARSQLLPIPRRVIDGEQVNRKEMLPHQRKYLLNYGDDVYTFPLGDAFLTLVYNKKVFEELKLSPPQSWAEYGEVANKLREAGHRVQEPLGEGWASRLLLNRAAAYIRTRGNVSTVFDIKSMKPLVDSQPFERALDEMASALGESIDTSLTPADVFNNLVNGDVAMGLTWPSKHFAPPSDSVNQDLEVARIPGSPDWFDRQEGGWSQRYEEVSTRMELMGSTGLVASINSDSANTSVAIEFASWICSKPTSTRTSVECPSVSFFRATHLGQPTKWTGERITSETSDQYAQVFREISENDIAFLFPRIPGQAEYLQKLDEAVIAFAEGNKTISEAMSKVSEEWELVTERLGRSDQIRFLRRSEGFGG